MNGSLLPSNHKSSMVIILSRWWQTLLLLCLYSQYITNNFDTMKINNCSILYSIIFIDIDLNSHIILFQQQVHNSTKTYFLEKNIYLLLQNTKFYYICITMLLFGRGNEYKNLKNI